MHKTRNKLFQTRLFGVLAAALMVLNLGVTPSMANAMDQTISLEALTEERQTLADELLHYKKALALLHPDISPAQDSENPAVRTLAAEMDRIRQRLIKVTEQEVTLLQEQIITASGARTAATAS